MNVGSLFSGIGGFDLGLERAGMHVAWQCEADPFCRRVLAHHWPDVPCYPDVRELSNESGWLEYVDVLCGGFPCQDISSIGKREGIEGERSGLWGEFARLIGEIRPRYVLVENVAALRSRGLDRVLGDLAALGYDAESDCVAARAAGAPHERDRVWIMAYPSRDAEEGTAEATRPEWKRAWESREYRGAPSRSSWWAVEPGVARVADGVPDRLDRLASLGNALVPQLAQWLGERVLAREAQLVTEAAA